MTDVLLTNAILVSVLMTLVWLLSVFLRDVSIVDLIWGLGFVLIAWASCWSVGAWDFAAPSQGLLPILASVWGLRLSGHLAWRNLGHSEDKRYAAMREKRRESFWWKSFFMVFGLQGLLMWLIAMPLQFGIARPVSGWHWQHALGITIWAVGLFFEAVGDWQLMRFRSDPTNRGKVLDQGLWSYTRHPNYFGDFCIWWGLFTVATAHGVHLWTIFGPIVMSIFLMKVSGVTLLESTLKSEKPGYAEYMKRTNAFFPGPPRRTAAGE